MSENKLNDREWVKAALDQYKRASGLSKTAIAKKLGYSLPHLNSMENGTRNVTNKLLHQVSELTGLPIPEGNFLGNNIKVNEPKEQYGNQFELLLKEYQKHMEDLRDNIKDLRASVEDLRRENLYLHDQNKNHQQ